MPVINANVDEEHTKHVREYARRKSCSVDSIIREAIEMHMEANKPKLKQYAYRYVGGKGLLVKSTSLSEALAFVQKQHTAEITYISEVFDAPQQQPMPMPMPCVNLRDNGTCSATHLFIPCNTCPKREIHPPGYMRSPY